MTDFTSQNELPRRKQGFQFSEKHLPIALILPSLIIIVLVVGLPMSYSLYLSLTNFTFTTAKSYHFVGLENYIHLLFQDKLFWPVFGRTILFTTIAVNVEFVLGLGIAQLMARAIRGQSLARTLMMMPMMFAPILVGFQFKWFFNAQIGLVNNLLYTITGHAQFIPWLIEKNLGFMTLMIAEIWMSTPFMAIILEAGLLSLPQEPFEAAEIDGASGWQKFQLITLPLLMPFIYTAMAIRSLDIARAYDVVNIMTGGGPANRTELMWTYVNRLAFSGQQFAMGTAMSYITVIFSCLFTFMLFQNVLKSRWAGEMGE
jgi:multiple sugar transport system permease protein